VSDQSQAAPSAPPVSDWSALLDLALAEDVGPGDVTSDVVIDAARRGRGRIEARQPMVVCGLPIAREVFRRVDPDLVVESIDGIEDGVVAEAHGPTLRNSKPEPTPRRSSLRPLSPIGRHPEDDPRMAIA